MGCGVTLLHPVGVTNPWEGAVIHIVTDENASQYRDELIEAGKLRHAVFVDEMGWEDIRQPNGIERDQFDGPGAVHMLFLDGGRLLGYQRMLPTKRPHLLSEVMPHLCEGPRPEGEHIWEWTRYCVPKEHRERGRKLSPVANALLSGIVEWGLPRGIDTIVIQMDPLWLLRLVQLHFLVTPLGFPHEMSGRDTIAVTARFNRLTLARLQEMRGNDRPVLYEPVRRAG